MREWKSTIAFVGFFSRKGNMFNGQHHSNMRAKFLQVRLRRMEKIVEDPSSVCRVPMEEDKQRMDVAMKTKKCKEISKKLKMVLM